MQKDIVIIKYIKLNKLQRLLPGSKTYIERRKTFRRRPGRPLNVLCTSDLRPVSSVHGIRLFPFSEYRESEI